MRRTQSATVDLPGFIHALAARNPFSTATYVAAAIVAVASALLFRSNPFFAMSVIAILFGWSEVSGLCGTSHLGTLTPLRALDDSGELWLKAVGCYTLAGVVTASGLGAFTGLIGELAHFGGSAAFFLLVCGAALALAAKEMGWLCFELPQIRRQTQKMWQFQFGVLTAATMWGAHIGLGVATVIAHGGFFIVLAFALTLGPVSGALLMAAYWLGRTLPLWLATSLTSDPARGESVAQYVLSSPGVYRHAAAIGLLCASIVALRMAT